MSSSALEVLRNLYKSTFTLHLHYSNELPVMSSEYL